MALSSPNRRSLVTAWMLATAVCLSAGCDTSTTDGPVAEVTPPTAEERFELLVTALRRQVEDSGLTASTAAADYNAAPGTPVPTARVRVSDQLIPPDKEGDPFRGSICLLTKSKVTVVLPQPTEDELEEKKAKREAKLKKMEDDLEGVADLESLAIPSGAVTDRLSKSPIHEIKPDETPSCYELEFRDGAWVLLTELDEENEPFYAAAIEYALKRQ